MFDMLDDGTSLVISDDLDMGYVPSAPSSKSRAGSMKYKYIQSRKLSKKQPKKPVSAKPTKINEFDDLMDDILQQQTKAMGSLDNKSNISKIKDKKDDFDMLLDDPKPKSLQKNKLALKQEQPAAKNISRNVSFKMDESDDIISEDVGSFGRNLSKPTTATNNNSKLDPVPDDIPVFSSSRNMKPPLRKKESQSSINPPLTLSNAPPSPLTIKEDKEFNLTLSSNKGDEDSDIIKPPSRMVSRKPPSMIDSSAGLRSESLTLAPEKKVQNKQEDSKKTKGLVLSLDSPVKTSTKQQPKNTFSFSKDTESASFKLPENDKEIKLFDRKSSSLDKPKSEVQLQIRPPQKTGSSGLQLPMQQSYLLKDTTPAYNSFNAGQSRSSEQLRKGSEQPYDASKEFEHMKSTLQKQIQFLNQNLENQLRVNRQTRDKIMGDADKMIAEERRRSKQIYQQELTRQKDMFEWQRKRLQQNYKAQISALKQQLEFSTSRNNTDQNSQYNKSKYQMGRQEDIQYLQLQLKNQKKILEDRQKILDRRQNEIDQRQKELNKRRKREQDNIREQERKFIETESKLKRQLMEERKALAEQKQQMAIQLANLEVQAMRKREKADNGVSQNRQEREALERQRTELRLANAELLRKHRFNTQQIEEQRLKIKQLEADLLKKLRVVQLKNQQISVTDQRQKEQSKANTTMYDRKENNWIQQKDRSFEHPRGMSVEKRSQKDRSFNDYTKERFKMLENNTRSKLNMSYQDNKGKRFDLDNYMLTVDNYNKMKMHA